MKISPYLLLALANFFWSLNIIVSKLLSDSIPPVTVGFFRWGLPLLYFLPYAIKEIKSNEKFYKDHWALFLVLGGTGYCFNVVFFYEGVLLTNTINVSFINAFNPVLIGLTGFFMYRYKISLIQIIGFILSFAGVLWLVFKGNMAMLLSMKVNIGDLFILVSGISWSIYTIMYKKHSGIFIKKSFFSVLILYGVALMVPGVIAENIVKGVSWIPRLGIQHVLGIIFLCVFPSILAYKFWNQALTKVEANKAAISHYLIPLSTIIISLLFLDEQLHVFQLAGGALICVGILLVANPFSKKAVSREHEIP
jgi:drug/metabolite transporter (DMT)-like permease